MPRPISNQFGGAALVEKWMRTPMQTGAPYAKVACLALTVRELRRELEAAERDLTALMDAEFPSEAGEPPYLTNRDPGDER